MLTDVCDKAKVVEIVSCIAGVILADVVDSMSASIFPPYTRFKNHISYKTSNLSIRNPTIKYHKTITKLLLQSKIFQ